MYEQLYVISGAESSVDHAFVRLRFQRLGVRVCSTQSDFIKE